MSFLSTKNTKFQGDVTTDTPPDADNDQSLVTTAALNRAGSNLMYHPSCRVGLVGNINVASPGAILDGVTMVAGDRVYLMEQTTNHQRGPWVWNGAAVPMTRPADWATGSVKIGEFYFPITEGSRAWTTLACLMYSAGIVGTTAPSTTPMLMGTVLHSNSPDLLGTPTAPTAAAGTNSTQIANMAAVRQAVTDVGMAAPIGTVVAFAGTTAPVGWLLCYGQAISRTTYADLFNKIGTTYGVGDGSTTFNIIDMRGRVGVGLDNMGGTDAGVLTSANTLGLGLGEEKHLLTSAESGLPDHTHSYPTDTSGNAALGNTTNNSASKSAGAAYTGYPATAGVIGGAANAAQSHNIMQPSRMVNYIIKAMAVEDSPAWGNSGVRLVRSANSAALTAGSWAPVTWDTEQYDDGLHSTVSSTDRITVIQPGRTNVKASISFGNTASAYYAAAKIRHFNAAGVEQPIIDYQEDSFAATGVGPWKSFKLSGTVIASVGDYFIAEINPNIAGIVVFGSTATPLSSFEANRVGYQTNPEKVGRRAFEVALGSNVTVPTTMTDIFNTGAITGDGQTSLVIRVQGTITNTGTGGYQYQIWDGATGTGTQYLNDYGYGVAASNQPIAYETITIPPWTGTKTFYFRAASQGAGGLMYGNPTATAYMRGIWTAAG